MLAEAKRTLIEAVAVSLHRHDTSEWFVIQLPTVSLVVIVASAFSGSTVPGGKLAPA
jgi:hypothetical protein